jgi:hypothetical protein
MAALISELTGKHVILAKRPYLGHCESTYKYK